MKVNNRELFHKTHKLVTQDNKPPIKACAETGMRPNNYYYWRAILVRDKKKKEDQLSPSPVVTSFIVDNSKSNEVSLVLLKGDPVVIERILTSLTKVLG